MSNFIYLPYPQIPDSFEHPLAASIALALKERQQILDASSRYTRSTLIPWRERWHDVLSQNTTMPSIVCYLSQAIHCPAEWLDDVPFVDMVDITLSISVLLSEHRHIVALGELSMWQAHIANQVNKRQRSVLVETADNITDLFKDQDSEDMDMNSSDSENDWEQDFFEGERSSIGDNIPDDIHSNPHYTQSLCRCETWMRMLEAILVLPSGKESISEQLRARVEQDFDEQFGFDITSVAFQERQRTLVKILKEMKAVKASDYGQLSFVLAVRDSGLGELGARVAHPTYYMSHFTPHNALLWRYHHFGVVLGGLLDKWTPETWMDEVRTRLGITKNSDNPFSTEPHLVFPEDGERLLTEKDRKMQTKPKGELLLAALVEFPTIIPRWSNPAAVYFLLSESNFEKAWYRWLGWYLYAVGYRVHDIEPKSLFRDFLRGAVVDPETTDPKWFQWKLPAHYTLSEPLKAILRWTVKIREYKKKLPQEIRKSHPLQCTQCQDQPPNKMCRRDLIMPIRSIPDNIRGIGVTNAPEGDRMVPQKGRSKKCVTKLVSTSDLDLDCIEPDPEVLKRCGMQLFRVKEEEGGPVVDIILFNAFAKKELNVLIDNLHYGSGVKALKRGMGFDFWSSGYMFPFGARLPAGGRPGDSYVFYAGIEAETVEGIEVLFRHAESSMIIMEVTKVFHRQLYDELMEGGSVCESTGLTGLNLFDCDGYTAPIHVDDDAVRSICCQFEKSANHQYHEFGFCSVEYGYYIDTLPNTLWSFHASKLHGTVLPSESSRKKMAKKKRTRRQRGDAETVYSRGDHETIRKRDRKHAQRCRDVRANTVVRQQVWRSSA